MAQRKAKEQQPRNDFFERVWDMVAEIPVGKVTTYGHIAEHLGAKSAARTVGWAMNAAAGTGLPAHRVVNRFGALSGKVHFGGRHIMEDLLRSEGVTFTEDGCVDMDKHLWVPGE
jgi:O-6-methylguanine DNA methyltransferase